MKTLKEWIELIADDYTRTAALEKLKKLDDRNAGVAKIEVASFDQSLLRAFTWAQVESNESVNFWSKMKSDYDKGIIVLFQQF